MDNCRGKKNAENDAVIYWRLKFVDCGYDVRNDMSQMTSDKRETNRKNYVCEAAWSWCSTTIHALRILTLWTHRNTKAIGLHKISRQFQSSNFPFRLLFFFCLYICQHNGSTYAQRCAAIIVSCIDCNGRHVLFTQMDDESIGSNE